MKKNILIYIIFFIGTIMFPEIQILGTHAFCDPPAGYRFLNEWNNILYNYKVETKIYFDELNLSLKIDDFVKTSNIDPESIVDKGSSGFFEYKIFLLEENSILMLFVGEQNNIKLFIRVTTINDFEVIKQIIKFTETIVIRPNMELMNIDTQPFVIDLPHNIIPIPMNNCNFIFSKDGKEMILSEYTVFISNTWQFDLFFTDDKKQKTFSNIKKSNAVLNSITGTQKYMKVIEYNDKIIEAFSIQTDNTRFKCVNYFIIRYPKTSKYALLLFICHDNYVDRYFDEDIEVSKTLSWKN